MKFKKIIGFLHLWIGLITGVVVFIVCITAAIWAFSPEIQDWTQEYRTVKIENKPVLLPSQILTIAQKQIPNQKIGNIGYLEEGKAIKVNYRSEDFRATGYFNPYSGKVLKIVNNKDDFFSIVVTGHYTLWLGEIGSEIVRWATLLFCIMLISGIILWWPKNKSAAKQRFRFKWKENMKWKRKNYDLHNVLGFYAAWIVLFAVLSGLVWTFECVRDAEYWLASGGEKKVEYPNPIAKKPNKFNLQPNGIDSVFTTKIGEYSNVYFASVSFPKTDSTAYSISVYPDKTYYSRDAFYYNQYTFQEIPVKAYGKYANANAGEKLSRMNYDIHIGSIFGLSGRIAMFLAVIIGASLPITGFYIWWGRNNKKKNVK